MIYKKSIKLVRQQAKLAEDIISGKAKFGEGILLPVTAVFANDVIGSVEFKSVDKTAKLVVFENDEANLAESEAEARVYGEWKVDHLTDTYIIVIEEPDED